MIRTDGQITGDASANDDSVTVINEFVGLSTTRSLTDLEKAEIVRNIEHLRIGIAKTDWGSVGASTQYDNWLAAITAGAAKTT